VTRQDVSRPVVVLLLQPAEAQLVRQALERMPKRAAGNGESRMVQNVLEMLASASFTERELGELSRLGDGR
jgi:hypothetical protein